MSNKLIAMGYQYHRIFAKQLQTTYMYTLQASLYFCLQCGQRRTGKALSHPSQIHICAHGTNTTKVLICLHTRHTFLSASGVLTILALVSRSLSSSS